MNRFPVTVLTVLLVWTASLPAADSTLTKPGPVEFHRDVAPILKAKCLACHGGKIAEGKLRLDGLEHVQAGSVSGKVIVAGDAAGSLLFQSVSGESPEMPPQPNDLGIAPLTDAERTLLSRWINEGAPAGKPVTTENVRWRSIPESRRQIYSLALSPDDSLLAVGQANRVLLYDLFSRREVGRLTTPELNGAADRDLILAMTFHPDGHHLATGGYRNVKIWKKQPARALFSQTFDHPVRIVRTDRSGQRAAVLLEDSELFLWDLISPMAPRAVSLPDRTIADLQFSPDGKQLVVGTTPGDLICVDTDGEEQITSISTGLALKQLAPGPQQFGLASIHDDGTFRLWKWSEILAPEAEAPQPQIEFRHPAETGTVATWQRVGPELLTAGSDQLLRRWNMLTGQLISERPVQVTPGHLLNTLQGEPLLVSQDGKILNWLTEEGGLKFAGDGFAAAIVRADKAAATSFELAELRKRQASQKLVQSESEYENRKSQLTLRSEERAAADERLATQNEMLQRLLDEKEELERSLTDSGKASDSLNDWEAKHKTQAERVEQAIAESQVATRKELHAQQAVQFGSEQVRRRRTLVEEAELEAEQSRQRAAMTRQQLEHSCRPIQGLAFSEQDERVYAAASGEPIRSWNSQTGQPVDPPLFSGRPPRHLSALPDRRLLSIDSQGTAVVWDLTPTWELERILGPESQDLSNLEGSRIQHRVNAIAFSPNGETLATGGGDPSRSGEVLLWNLNSADNPVELIDAHSDTVQGLQFSRNGNKLVTCAADRFCKLFDVPNRTLITSFEGHTDHVLGVALSPDEELLVSVGADRMIKIWEVETGELKRAIDQSSRQITAVRFLDRLGERILSSSGDHHLRIHQVSTGENTRSLIGAEDYVYACVPNSEGNRVIAGGEDGAIRIWDAQTGEQLFTWRPKPHSAD